MAHAHHFLERLDRVTRAQTEFALGLYRDHEAVKYVLEHASLVEGIERVALAIGDARVGPYVIVTREGKFVTCLGEGMSTGPWPVVPRAQIDGLLAKLGEKRTRKEVAQREMRPYEEEEDLFGRVFTRGSRLSREDFLAVSAFEAMLGTTPYLLMQDFALDVIKERPGATNVKKVHGGIAKPLEKHDKLTWAVGHLTLLSGVGERKDLDRIVDMRKDVLTSSPTYLCSAQAGHTFFMRSAWLAARLGKAMLPAYKAALENLDNDWLGLLDAALCIAAIGLRHQSAFSDARRILAAQFPLAEANPKDIRYIARAAFGQWIGKVMDEADDNHERAIKCGQTFCVTLSQGLPDDHPLRFKEEEKVPVELAKAAVLSFDADPHNETIQNLTMSAVALAAKVSAEEFFYPREVVRAWFGAWDVDEALYRLTRFAEQRDKKKKEPVRAAPAPGRNDPCPCGSGKKWKKCHGGGAPPPPVE